MDAQTFITKLARLLVRKQLGEVKLRIVQRDCFLLVSNKQNHNASDSLFNRIVKVDVIALKLTLFKIQTAMQSN